MKDLPDFILESNRIEGIDGTSDSEVAAYHAFLQLDYLSIDAVVAVLGCIQPGAKLRNRRGMDVRVGNHFPPIGGPDIEGDLAELLIDADDMDAFTLHVKYEMLHPFTDGNGRTGRLIWLWRMRQDGYNGQRLFLHEFYYQTLAQQRISP